MSAQITDDKVAVDDGLDNQSSDVESNDSFANPTGINEKRLLRKLDLKLLPPLTLLYLLSFLDRSNSKHKYYVTYKTFLCLTVS